MVCIICEPKYTDNIWEKQKFDGLLAKLKKRRIKYEVIEQLNEVKNISDSDEPIIVIAIGAHKAWYSYIVKQCNVMNVRVITFGENFSDSVSGNFSCVTSDLKSSVIDICRYFTAYGKKKALLYNVNNNSEFDLALKNEILNFLPENGMEVDLIEKSDSNDDAVNEFINRLDSFDSVICTNDYSAILLLQRIKETNPEYLKQIFLVSFSNTLLSLTYSPSVTTFYETDIGDEYVIKIYYLLMQNPEISNIHFSIKEHIKIRETTQYHPYMLLESGNIQKNVESAAFSFDDDKRTLKEPAIDELERIEKMLKTLDRIDYNILSLLLDGKSTLEISGILYTSRGSVRYRIGRMIEKLGFESRGEMINLLNKYVSSESLCRLAENSPD